MSIELLSRDGTHLRYVVRDDNGHDLRQVDRDMPHVIAEAARTKKSIVDVLERLEGGEPVKIRIPRQRNRVVPPVPHDHEEFDDFLRGVPDHDEMHKGFSLAGHEHEGVAFLSDMTLLEKHVQDNELGEAAAHEAINRRIDEHEVHHSFAAVKHDHDALEQRLENLEKLVTALTRGLAEHVHVDVPHSHGELVVLDQGVTHLRQLLGNLQTEVRGQAHHVAAHDHDSTYAPKDSLDGFASRAALEEHIESAKRRTNGRVLSEEYTNGKRRIIFEEEG